MNINQHIDVIINFLNVFMPIRCQKFVVLLLKMVLTHVYSGIISRKF